MTVATTPLVVHPSLTLASGYTVQCRRLAADVVARLSVAAAQELEAEKPALPAEGEQPGEELKAWQAKVNALMAAKLTRILQSYAILNPTDAEAVAAHRAALATEGVTFDDDDRVVYCWHILAPTAADQQQLAGFVLGKPAPATN